MKQLDLVKVGNFIAKLRKESGLTQEELANKLMISDKAVSKWEGGKNLPDIECQRQICKLFNISLEELHNGERDLKKRTKTKRIFKENTMFKIMIICLFPVFVFLFTFFIINYRAIKIYYSRDNRNDSEESLTADFLIIKNRKQLLLMFDHITPINDVINESDLVTLNVYSDNSLISTTNDLNDKSLLFKNRKIDLDKLKIEVVVTTIDDEVKTFVSEPILHKLNYYKATDDYINSKLINKKTEVLSKSDIIKILESEEYNKIDDEIYEKTIKNNDSCLKIKYNLSINKVDIMYVFNNYVTKIKGDYETENISSVVYNNDNLNNVVEKYYYNYKTKEKNCVIGECTTLNNVRKDVAKYITLPQVE